MAGRKTNYSELYHIILTIYRTTIIYRRLENTIDLRTFAPTKSYVKNQISTFCVQWSHHYVSYIYFLSLRQLRAPFD
jgi:hypothetical protein